MIADCGHETTELWIVARTFWKDGQINVIANQTRCWLCATEAGLDKLLKGSPLRPKKQSQAAPRSTTRLTPKRTPQKRGRRVGRKVRQ